MLKVRTMDIRSINGIKDLFVGFNPGLNFICGPNGIGKTTILNCISSTFKRKPSPRLFPHINANYGGWAIEVDHDNHPAMEYFYVGDHPENIFDFEKEGFREYNSDFRDDCIDFNIQSRVFEYNTSSVRTPFNHIKSWFYRNYYKNEMGINKFYNLQLAQKCFNLLDPNISFGRVSEAIVTERHPLSRNFQYKRQLEKKQDPNSRYMPPIRKELDMFVNTSQGEVLVEFLSSGYKSCLTVLLGIIRGVEGSSMISQVDEFRGIIIIDEIDLHLHPQWQAKLVYAIRELVPKAQVICTTHSPHIIQVAKPEEVIVLGEDKYGGIHVKQIPSHSEYGFQGWTIEEILTDVMGLEQSMSPLFLRSLENFNKALRINDREVLMAEYKKLRKMVHPQNPLATLLSVQAGELMIGENFR
ncbi:AAA family ATPase [Bacillus wiedmannii]|uniref:AAA family ATPase n=1 Tax=Bacillus wiedmannii TaxID=1890302 RepID=UPI002E245F54|nr:AAA family ATPase [Bacillus wiedmannii]